jgi:GMP synthase (glutamine-hydrolysing)
LTRQLRFIIVDGYDRDSRNNLVAAGMKVAADLYREMLLRELPDAQSDILFPSDASARMPAGAALEQYDGLLWTGCNATIYEHHPPVVAQIELSKKAYEIGVPQFGSCWGLQMAVVAAGGEVAANPNGREMGIARRILLTEAGKSHPMMAGRATVFEHFTSHVDEVTKLPAGAVHLAGNPFTTVQAAAVRHLKGVFWGVQYHPEYDVHEMARLTVARQEKLLGLGFYRSAEALHHHVDSMEALHAEPHRLDLRWLLVIGDDVLDPKTRTLELSNWLQHVVLPRSAKR